ncbi:MAG: GGDEF domain-containing protein, partial [Mangrovicoccus sp.]
EHLDIVAVVLIATLFGCGLTLYGLWALLSPLRFLRDAIDDIDQGIAISPLHMETNDEIGQLMNVAQRLIQNAGNRLASAIIESQTDPLTGLMNRRGFDDFVPQNGSGAMLSIDVDHFKSVNDTYGHAAGDKALQDIAETIDPLLRKDDLIARIGGEEFIAWLPGADHAEAMFIAERIRKKVAETVRVADRALTVSIGVSTATSEAQTPNLQQQADAALYDAKAKGRDRVCNHPQPTTASSSLYPLGSATPKPA